MTSFTYAKKPTNWRARYWHKPPSLAWSNNVGDIRRIENAYHAWLAAEGRDAGAVIAAPA